MKKDLVLHCVTSTLLGAAFNYIRVSSSLERNYSLRVAGVSGSKINVSETINFLSFEDVKALRDHLDGIIRAHEEEVDHG